MRRSISTLLPILPAVVALVTYANTIPGSFVRDDVPLIRDSEELRAFDLRRIFLETYWGRFRLDSNYRPVTLLSYALNYRLGTGPLGFHLVNVLLNAAVAVVAYLVLRELLRERALAALGASMYAALPIHTEVVANIVGRAELLAALSVLTIWFLLLKHPLATWRRAVVAGLIVFIGVASKESAVVVIPLLLADALVRRQRMPWKALATATVAVAVFVLAGLLVVWDNLSTAAAGKGTLVTFLDNPLHWRFQDPVTSFVNALRLLGLYAWKTVVPLKLSADYSYNQLPVLQLADPRLWAGALAVVAPGAAAFFFLVRRAPIAALGLAFFFVTFAVTSNLLLPIGTIFGERLAYLPSFGFVLFLVGLLHAGGRTFSRGIVYGALSLLTVTYAAHSVRRNRVWCDTEALQAATALDAPQSSRAQFIGAGAFMSEARRETESDAKKRLLTGAHERIDRALEIYPENGRALGRRGHLCLLEAELALEHGDREAGIKLLGRAEEAFTEAVLLFRRKVQSEPLLWRLRGRARYDLARHEQDPELQKRRFAAAFSDLDFFARLAPQRGVRVDSDTFGMRGLCRAMQADEARRQNQDDQARRLLRESLADFDRAVRLAGDDASHFNNRGFCRFKLGDLGGAIADYRRGLRICREKGILFSEKEDSVVSFHRKLADAYRAKGDEEAARRELQAAANAAAEHRRVHAGRNSSGR